MSESCNFLGNNLCHLRSSLFLGIFPFLSKLTCLFLNVFVRYDTSYVLVMTYDVIIINQIGGHRLRYRLVNGKRKSVGELCVWY